MIQNRRDLPRIDTDFPVEVLLDSGAVIAVDGVNVSPGGIQLGCDAGTAKSMVLQASTVSPDAGAEFRLRWEFPGPRRPEHRGGAGAISVRARLRWSSPSGKGGHRLGLQFLEFECGGRERLTDFVEESMRP